MPRARPCSKASRMAGRSWPWSRQNSPVGSRPLTSGRRGGPVLLPPGLAWLPSLGATDVPPAAFAMVALVWPAAGAGAFVLAGPGALAVGALVSATAAVGKAVA